MFEPQGFSAKIFRERYSFTETETWAEACARVARQMATAETPALRPREPESRGDHRGSLALQEFDGLELLRATGAW